MYNLYTTKLWENLILPKKAFNFKHFRGKKSVVYNFRANLDFLISSCAANAT